VHTHTYRQNVRGPPATRGRPDGRQLPSALTHTKKSSDESATLNTLETAPWTRLITNRTDGEEREMERGDRDGKKGRREGRERRGKCMGDREEGREAFEGTEAAAARDAARLLQPLI